MARSKKSEVVDESGAGSPVDEVAAADGIEDAVVLEEPKTDNSDAQEQDTNLPETESEPADSRKPVDSTPAPAAPRGRSGFVPTMMGGVVAAALGFGTSQYLGNDSWPFSGSNVTDRLVADLATESAATAEAQTKIQELGAELADVKSRLANPPADVRITAMAEQAATQQQTTDALTAQLADLGQRIGDLENRPIPDVGATKDAVAAYQLQLAGMRAMFEKELARVEASQATAAQQEQTAAQRAEQAAARAAFARLQAAIESGAPFDEALTGLTDAGVAVPDVLSTHAAEGVPTLAGLQQAYSAPARAALDAAIRAQSESGTISKFEAFMRTQLGTRSLAPKTGEDPDAILSRAEAALKEGSLPSALSEIATLPEAGRNAMQAWVTLARTRVETVDAVAALASTMNN